MILRVIIMSFLLLPGVAIAQSLSELERRLVATADARGPAAVELLEKVVAINSGTMNLEGVRKVARVFRPELEALDFAVTWVPGEAFDRAGHLVATRASEGPGVLLIGHLDTVFEADSPFQSSAWVGEDLLRGPGTTDMKGGVVVMLEALAALNAEGLLDGLDLRVVLMGDEEKSGRPLSLAREALRRSAKGAVWALGFEDGDGRPETAVISRRGSSGWQVTVRGRPAPSWQRSFLWCSMASA